MTESQNPFEAPESRIVGNNFIVHRPLFNLIAATFSWGFGVFGLMIIIGLLAGLPTAIDNHGGWQVFLLSKFGLLRALVWVLILASSVNLLMAGYSFFRVNQRRAKTRILTALAIGLMVILIPLVSR